MKSNVIDEKQTQERIDETLDFLTNTVSKSLGFYGKTGIIQDRFMKHTITKDGYTLLKSIQFDDDLERTILEIVKKISKTLVRKVGDGSTSSIIVANFLYKELFYIMKENSIAAKDILRYLNIIVEYLESELKKQSLSIDNNMNRLVDIASISCNNDEINGSLVAEIFRKIGRYGFINLEKSATNATYYTCDRGYEIHRGYINQLMVNQSDKETVILENPLVLMCDGVINSNDMSVLADFLGEICYQMGQSLVIIANGFDNDIANFFHINLLNARKGQVNFNFLAIDIAYNSQDTRNKFDDLAINLGCKPIKKTEGQEFNNIQTEWLGTCEKVKGTEYTTSFINGKGDELEIKERIENLEKELDKKDKNETIQEYDEEIYEIRKRIALLQNSMANLYVGGNSEQEKETDIFLLEDAISACKSALKNGYTIGGTLTIPFFINDNFSDDYIKNLKDIDELSNHPLFSKFSFTNLNIILTLLNSISNAFKETYKLVLTNKFINNETKVENVLDLCIKNNQIYNLTNDKFEDLKNTKVINSIETDIEILKSAVSIIGLLATSNQFIGINTYSN